jgi:hypothetical protein
MWDAPRPDDLPGAGAVLGRSIVWGFTSGTLVGLLVGASATGEGIASFDRLSFAMFGSWIGILFGTPMGLILGVVLALWRTVGRGSTASIRWVVTALSVVMTSFILWRLEGDMTLLGSRLLLIVNLFPVGLLTWLGVPIVLRPTPWVPRARSRSE